MIDAADKAFDELGVQGWIMCHLSHSYHSGACLYFTFAFKWLGPRDALDEYDAVKRAIQQAFIDDGGTLSHHHAVGTRARAVARAGHLGAGRRDACRALFDGVDPGAQPQPGQDRVTEPPELDVAWARSAPARVVREAVLVGGLRPSDVPLHVSHGARPRAPRRDRAAGRVRRQPLEPHGHARDPARAAGRWRRRTAVAAAADYFYVKRRLGWTVSLFFGTVPVARDGRGLDHDSTAHIEAAFQQGWSLVMYAEGTRSRDGSVGKLRSGSAVLAAQHDLSLVPIHVSGSHEVMPVGRYWPKFARVSSATPSRSASAPRSGRTDEEHRTEVMERVRDHLEHS